MGIRVPGDIFALLIGITIDHVVDEVGSDTAIVQQRIGLPRNPISHYALSGVANAHQALQ